MEITLILTAVCRLYIWNLKQGFVVRALSIETTIILLCCVQA